MREDLSGVRRTEKKSEPARRPMTRASQFLLSLGSYEGMVKVGVGFKVLRMSSIVEDTGGSTGAGSWMDVQCVGGLSSVCGSTIPDGVG